MGKPVFTLVNGVEGQLLRLGDDSSLLDGQTVFEGLRSYGGPGKRAAVFRLGQHLERLEKSALFVGFPFPGHAVLRAEIVRAKDAVVTAGAGARDAWIRVTLTAEGTRIVQAGHLDESRVGRALRVASVVSPPASYMPGFVKHGSRAPWLAAARRMGVDEIVLLRSPGGAVLELNRSNVLAVRDGVLLTPPLDGDKLVGVTRGAVLDAARECGVPVREVEFSLGEPRDELWACSTLKEMVPLSHVDGVPAGGGPVGARVYASFRALVERETRGDGTPPGDAPGPRAKL